MSPRELAKSYDSIAEKWLAPGLQSNGIPQLERALQFATKRETALDIGCGCSRRFFDLLRREGFEVEGLDLSQKMMELARKQQPETIFHSADICSWDFPKKYDFITAWDSIWHVPLQDQEPVLKKICAGLTEGGIFIFTTGGLDAPTEKTDSFMGPLVYYSVLGLPKTLEVLGQNGCVCRHLEYDQYPEKHVYIIAEKVS